jgi:trafficking protein particle complex subunit 9
MNELEKVRRFETLTELYQQIGYHRKAAFCQRLAAWRHIAQNNTNPDWAASYRLMLESFQGHKLSLEPTEVLESNQGWPCLQIDLLQQLIGAARRLGQSALATRHMTFLLQTQWRNLSSSDQKEMALQLQNLSSQCEGSPVPLYLENGTFIPPANLTDLPFCETFQLKDLSASLRPHKIERDKVSNVFIFTPIHMNSSIDRRTENAKKRDQNVNFLWVQHDKSEIAIKLHNPLPFELQVTDMRLLTDGVVFESLPESVVLQPNGSQSISLFGTPLEVGELEMNGYSTHTLGVKSNCRLKHMFARNFPVNYKINVIPALPIMSITTSLPQLTTAVSSGLSHSEEVINSVSASLFNGETQICDVTIENKSNILIEYIETSLQSGFDQKLQGRIFSYNFEDIRKQLPIKPKESITFQVKIFGDADFVGPLSVSNPGNSLTPHQNDGPSSLSGINSYMSNSRVGSPIHRRTNDHHNMSFRSSTTASGATVNSGHSSLATLSLGAIMNGSNQNRQLEFKLIFKYSGGIGFNEDYCRHCALLFHVELIPSLQITNWDVLPAEVSSQFYLVLDIANLTNQEVSLNYPDNKTILIESKESCRVPVPVERCPLDKILADHQQQQQQQMNSSEFVFIFVFFFKEFL